MGAIIVADTVRPEAVRAVQALEQMRLKIVLLTGDTRRVAQRVARDLRISEFESDLLPEDVRTASRTTAVQSSGQIVSENITFSCGRNSKVSSGLTAGWT